MTMIEELEGTLRGVAERVGPSVVRIGRGWGRGSGVVLAEGLVLTNAHNLRGDETTVTFADGRSATATVRGVDSDGDVVVLAVDTAAVAPISWDPVEPAVGTAVIALANPAGRGLRATLGFVSAVGQTFRGPRGRRIAGSIEHTAPLSRGSSGGPIVDAAGRLIGINTNRVGDGFYEVPGSHHRISENASDSEPASLLAVFIVDSGDDPLTTPDPKRGSR